MIYSVYSYLIIGCTHILAGVAVCKQVKNVGLVGIGSHFGHHEKRGISLNNGLLQGSYGLVAFRLL